MHSEIANGSSRPSFWPRVREFAVPPSMIESATARRVVGDWAGACAAARVDVDLDLRSVVRTRGREFAARIRADLRQLAPDLLRWHLPRIAPDGLLRPGLTISLARYAAAGQAADPVHLVVRTPPAWADAGQRVSLALWDGPRSAGGPAAHPHPRPDRRFRLDLHRHLWDAGRAGELRTRSGAGLPPPGGPPAPAGSLPATPDSAGADRNAPGEWEAPRGREKPAGWDALRGRGCAVDRWAAEAAILLRERGRTGGDVTVRLGSRQRLVLRLAPDAGGCADPAARLTAVAAESARERGDPPPVLPDAATWVLPDLALLRAGLIEVERLHPLVAAALAPDGPPSRLGSSAGGTSGPRLVECRGAQHRIGLVDGVLVPLDHDPAEIRREELLAALTGTPLPCLLAIDEVHRVPECLVDVRARLDHGDTAGALATVEGLLGPDALLRAGALRDELETAARRRVTHGLFRAGLAGSGPGPASRLGPRSRKHRSHPRHATGR